MGFRDTLILLHNIKSYIILNIGYNRGSEVHHETERKRRVQ